MEYTGTDNLEIMASAHNYNKFLVDSIFHNLRVLGTQAEILDFGAGIGVFADRVSQEGFNVTCLEPDSQQAAVISEKGFKVARDLSQLEDASFDFIYTLNVLEHIEDDFGTVSKLYGLLKKGGTLFVYVPALPVLYSSMDKKVGHFRRYEKRKLERLMEMAGFHVKSAEYVDSAGFFATLLYILLGNKEGNINERALVMYDRYIFPVSRVLDLLFGRFFGKNLMVVCGK